MGRGWWIVVEQGEGFCWVRWGWGVMWTAVLCGGIPPSADGGEGRRRKTVCGRFSLIGFAHPPALGDSAVATAAYCGALVWAFAPGLKAGDTPARRSLPFGRSGRGIAGKHFLQNSTSPAPFGLLLWKHLYPRNPPASSSAPGASASRSGIRRRANCSCSGCRRLPTEGRTDGKGALPPLPPKSFAVCGRLFLIWF